MSITVDDGPIASIVLTSRSGTKSIELMQNNADGSYINRMVDEVYLFVPTALQHRIEKALKHAIVLCGGKDDPF